MLEVVRIKLKPREKIYYFKCDSKKYKPGQVVVVETFRGLECGEVMADFTNNSRETLSSENKILRAATKDDLKKLKDNQKKAKQAYQIFSEKIKEHKLKMKPVDAEYTLDTRKVIFYFSADDRIDFRGLVRDLASFFHIRIELRQIGIRDETKMMGGVGICGKPFCCSMFLEDFKPVLIKTAKDQGIFLSPSKISGNCGRLLCCLKYEEQTYLELSKITPAVGATVMTPAGEGVVCEANLLTGMLKVKIRDSPPCAIANDFNRKEVMVLKELDIEQMPIVENKKKESKQEENFTNLTT
ncbi:MAG: stage 0 sporulation protein [Oscillospiraceae bacterium]|jgi:cell fate regulator YaaT (PSP1 superfamily)|nr:stage 0 sporulation protein [Oscillospiraceae bacterium]